MKVLDLFCGCGGTAKGIKDACPEAEIIGIDINPQPDYPFNFVQKDIFDYAWIFDDFDFIWASPPCQGYSFGTVKWRNKGKKYPDLAGKTRELLLNSGKSFVMENVVGSPLRKDLMLCGEMFDLRIIRHRIFECHGFKPIQIPHKKHKRAVWNGTAIGVWSGGKPECFGDEQKRRYYVTVAGHGGDGGKGNTSLKAFQDAMQIYWTNNKKSICEAVPPKYSEYIFTQFLKKKDSKA